MVRIVDNTGQSFEEAILILDAADTNEGVRTEYEYLTRKFGERGHAWQLKQQQLAKHGGRYYDVMKIALTDGQQTTVYFDITHFFGKG